MNNRRVLGYRIKIHTRDGDPIESPGIIFEAGAIKDFARNGVFVNVGDDGPGYWLPPHEIKRVTVEKVYAD